MRTTEHGIEKSRDVENVHHMRLMTLLQELVREKGYRGAARVLELDRRTVTTCATTGRLSRRARHALERALQEGVGSAAARQRERNDGLEERVEALEKGLVNEVACAGQGDAQEDGSRRGRSPSPSTKRRPRGPGPVMPAPVPPSPVQANRRPVRRTAEGSLRRGPGCGGSIPTW